MQLPQTAITDVLLVQNCSTGLLPLTHSGAPMALEIRFDLVAPLPQLWLMTHPSLWQQQG